MPLSRLLIFSILLISLVLAQPSTANAADTNGDGFELILVPFDVDPTTGRPGLLGSKWAGELFIHNDSTEFINLEALTGCGPTECLYRFVPGYTGPIPGPRLAPPDHGVLFTIPAALAPHVTFSGRYFDTTKLAQPLGVAMPIIREGQFFRGTIYLLNVPAGSNVRSALRIYDPRQESGAAKSITFTADILSKDGEGNDLEIGTVTISTVAHRTLPLSPGFAAIYDLAALFPQIDGLSHFNIRVVPADPASEYWAVASATDNVTQSSTLITAQ